MNYEQYKESIIADISTCVDSMGVQPILFFGSGMSQRYIKTPTWNGLLEMLVEKCPKIDKGIVYYQQKHVSPITISSVFAESIREWAWEDQTHFPEELFAENQPADIYIKHLTAEIFSESWDTPDAEALRTTYSVELDALKSINPYAVLTTNYDDFLEHTFPQYTTVVGQEILRANYAAVGEIIKIHGCCSNPDSIVLTQNDYDEFGVKKKYLSAKLLTYFAEHPLIILGYSAQDPNVRALLSDIDEILSPNNELIPNIYLVEWSASCESSGKHPAEKLIPIDNDRSVRLKSITANSFEWLYSTLGSNDAISSINPKLLRSVLARTYQLVRQDIPNKTVEIDFQTLEHAVSSEEEFAKLYGITTLDDPSSINAAYPYSLTSVAAELGYTYWHYANELIKRLDEEQGINIKTSDNKYHIAIRAGNRIQTHKYSQACVDLLRCLKDGSQYEIEI